MLPIIHEDHYPIVSAPTPFIIGLPDMDSIAEYTAHEGAVCVNFVEVPSTHGGRSHGRFIDAVEMSGDPITRDMVYAFNELLMGWGLPALGPQLGPCKVRI